MKKYESPIAKIVEFEAVDVVALSLLPEFLITWGKNLKSVDIDGNEIEKAETSLENEYIDFYS